MLNGYDVAALTINSSGHIFAGTIGGGLFRSTDNGGTWTQMNVGLTSQVVNTLAINLSGHVFAGTLFGGVYRSTNNGDSWTQINTGLTNTSILSLMTFGSQIFTGTNGDGVFRSTNNGDTWTSVSIGMTNSFVRSLAVSPQGQLFAGTIGSGVFRSNDNGGNWSPINSGLTSLEVRSLVVTGSGFVFVGTYGGGIFRSVQSVTKVRDFLAATPKEFFLRQNYPNPFNPVTRFDVGVPSFGLVTVKIFDLLGREVTTLVNEELKPGIYNMKWDAGGMPSGAYFYTLYANGQVETRKMVLLR